MAVAKGLKVVGYFDCAGRRPGGCPQQRRLCRTRQAAERHDASSTSPIRQSRASSPRSRSPKERCRTKCASRTASCWSTARSFRSAASTPISRAASRSSTSAIRQSRRASPPGRRAACIASRSTAATSTARRSSTAISAMSSRSSISRIRQSRRKSAAGGCRGNGPPAAKSRPGKAPRTAAIIRCASATGSTPATGTAASSFSTSTTSPSRNSCRASTGARPSPGRRTPRCRCRFRCAGGASCWSPTKTSCASPARRRRPSCGWSTSPTKHGQFPSPASRWPRKTARRSRTTPACTSSARRSAAREIPIAWFAHGLRVVDIANPHAPKEVASFMPDMPDGAKRVQSNDVCFDDRGLIYLIDRTRGSAHSRTDMRPRR